jgi:hypothetical protein
VDVRELDEIDRDEVRFDLRCGYVVLVDDREHLAGIGLEEVGDQNSTSFGVCLFLQGVIRKYGRKAHMS